MKTKSSKAVLIYLPLAVIAASVIRFFQYLTLMDFNTGFYKQGTEAMGALIYIVLAVAAAGFIVLAAFRKKAGDAAFTLSSDGMGSHATQDLGAGFALSAVMLIIKGVSASGFDMVISFIAAIFFGAVGILMLKNVVPPAVSGHLLLVPAVYMFIVTATFFNSDLIILNRSDNLMLLITYVLFTLFLASLARFCSRLETKHSRMTQVILGGLTFIASGTHCVAKLLALCFGGEAVKGIEGVAPDAVAALFISGTFISMIFLTIKKKDIEYLIDPEEENKESVVKVEDESDDADDITDNDENDEDSVEY